MSFFLLAQRFAAYAENVERNAALFVSQTCVTLLKGGKHNAQGKSAEFHSSAVCIEGDREGLL